VPGPIVAWAIVPRPIAERSIGRRPIAAWAIAIEGRTIAVERWPRLAAIGRSIATAGTLRAE
jgi:hypothetical protein